MPRTNQPGEHIESPPQEQESHPYEERGGASERMDWMHEDEPSLGDRVMEAEERRHRYWGLLLVLLLLAGGGAAALLQFSPERRYERLITSAWMQAQAGSWQEAEVSIRKALEQRPDDKRMLNLLLDTLLAQRKVDEAVARLDQELRSHPDVDNLHRYLELAPGRIPSVQVEQTARIMRGSLTVGQRWMADVLLAREAFLDSHWSEAERLLLQAIDDNPKARQPRVDLGQLYLATNRPGDAMEVFHSRLNIDPTDWEAYLGIGLAQRQQGHTEEALNAFVTAGSSVGPGGQVALLNAASASMDLRNLIEARRFLQILDDRYPGDPEVRHLKFRQALLEHDEAEFFRQIDAVQTWTPQTFIEVVDWCLMLQHASWAMTLMERYAPPGLPEQTQTTIHFRALVAMNRFKQAQALAQTQSPPLRRFMEGEIAVARGQWDRAEQIYEGLLDDPSIPPEVSGLADLRLDGVRSVLHLSTRLNTRDQMQMQLAQGKGATVLQQLAKAQVHTPQTDLMGVLALLQMGDRDRALKALDAVLEKAPTLEDALIVWGEEVGVNHPTQGIARLRKALKQGVDGPRIRTLLGKLFYRAEDRRDAVEAWQEVLKRWPEHLPAAILLGQAAILDDRWSDSVRWWEIAVSLAPDNATALNNLAFALLKAGQQGERALRLAERATMIDPERAAYLDTLASALERSGQGEQAAQVRTHITQLRMKKP